MSANAAPLWVRWCARDALDGMIELEPLEELAYRRLLDLIVVTDDNLRDNDRVLAVATKTGRAWPRVKARLIELGKIETVDGFVRNHRVTAECIISRRFIAQKALAGQASAAARDASRNTLKRKGETPAAVGTADDTSSATDVGAGVPTNQESERREKEKEEYRASRSSTDNTVDGVRGRLKRQKPQLADEVLAECAAIWNEMAGARDLPQVSELTDARAKKLRTLLTQQLGGDLDRWRAYVIAIGQSGFLTGSGGRGWRADFDWACRESSVIAVREGKYADRAAA